MVGKGMGYQICPDVHSWAIPCGWHFFACDKKIAKAFVLLPMSPAFIPAVWLRACELFLQGSKLQGALRTLLHRTSASELKGRREKVV